MQSFELVGVQPQHFAVESRRFREIARLVQALGILQQEIAHGR
jgi:hypothetical protein